VQIHANLWKHHKGLGEVAYHNKENIFGGENDFLIYKKKCYLISLFLTLYFIFNDDYFIVKIGLNVPPEE